MLNFTFMYSNVCALGVEFVAKIDSIIYSHSEDPHRITKSI